MKNGRHRWPSQRLSRSNIRPEMLMWLSHQRLQHARSAGA